MQPKIANIKISRKSRKAFRGVCLSEYVPDGYFSDAFNLSSRGYPAIVPRRERGVISEGDSIENMYSHTEMLWQSGENLYYASSLAGTLSKGKKQFASLGAYIVIYPDKKILNTDTMVLSDMECVFSADSATVSPSNADGSDAESTMYAKIAANGIGVGFKEGDGVSISGLSSSGIDGSYLLQTVQDDFIVVIASVSESVQITGEIKVERRAPDLDFICSNGNRVWGCSNEKHEIRACRLGDPTNWNVFQGVSTDAYAASVPTPGDFTGCVSFLGSVIFFKEEEIVKLFGSKPSNFELSSSKMPGVEKGSGESLAFTNSILFYKGLAGIYAYDGAVPVLISRMLGDGKYSGARAGALEGRYYISMLDHRHGGYRLFVYDTLESAWHIESGGEIRFFAPAGNELYMASEDGNIYTVNGSGLWYDPSSVISTRLFLKEQLFSWHASTGAIAFTMPDRQYVSRMHIRFSLSEYGSLNVYCRYRDNEERILLASFHGERREATVPIRVPAVRGDSFYLTLEGRGEFAVKDMIFGYETGGDL